MPTSQVLNLGGLAVRVLVAGPDGPRPPLLLLHGGGTDSATLSWGGVLPALAAGRRVYAPDLPGYGESDRPAAAAYTLDYYCAVVTDLVAGLGLATFDLGGLSLGGGISLTYALAHPERVRRLVLVDTYGIQPTYPPQWLSYLLVRIPYITELTYLSTRSRPLLRASLGPLLKLPGSLTEELLDEVLAESRKPRAGRAFNAFQKWEAGPRRLRTNYLPVLHQLRAPTLIVQGGADTLVPLHCAQAACQRIPDCRLAVLPGAGHWAQRDQPAAFIAAVREFLDGD